MRASAELWTALRARDPAADGRFVYSVASTGVYCRPSCPSRPARAENIAFHATPEEAERAGFRPCRRCDPRGPSLAARHAAAVAAACRRMDAAEERLPLAALAAAAGLSPHHFHRVFRAQTGITPAAYAAARRAARARAALGEQAPVTEAIYAAGYGAPSRFYEKAAENLGMTPGAYRAGGRAARLRFAIGQCTLGAVLVAASEVGVAAILLGDDPETLLAELQQRFPRATLIGADADFERTVALVVGLIDTGRAPGHLPLDIAGTAFQQQVWSALARIPRGRTATYAEIAAAIGRAGATRAVAAACAANPLAVAIPCHRVVRTDGELAGYRWGLARKAALLAREREPSLS